MKYGRSLDVLRGAVEKRLVAAVQGRRGGAVKADVCAETRADLVALGEEFDPFDGPVDYAISKAYDERAKQRAVRCARGVDVAVRWLEVAHDSKGRRVDRRAEQLTLLEAEEAFRRRAAQHVSDGVWVARWERVLAAANRAAEGLDDAAKRKATLGSLLGTTTLDEMLGGSERAA